MTKPDVIKQAQAQARAREKAIYSQGYQAGETANAIDVWNEAIEQCLIVNAKFNGSTEVDAAIRKFKK